MQSSRPLHFTLKGQQLHKNNGNQLKNQAICTYIVEIIVPSSIVRGLLKFF